MSREPAVLTLDLGGRRVPILLTRGKGARIRISVLSNGQVRANAPRRVTDEEFLAFAREKSGWIKRTLKKVESYTRLAAPGRAETDDTISILGERYPVQVEKSARPSARFGGGILTVRVPRPDDAEAVRKRLEDWLRRRAEGVFALVLGRCLKAAAVHGVPAPREWTVRRMKRRWGSCGRDGRIVFNVRLVQTPLRLVEYVILHELCHLRHHNHGRNYYALLSRCLPDWKERRKELGRIVVD